MYKIFLYLFGFFVATFLALFFILSKGVVFKNISYDNINIQKIYIKYDKELLLNIHKLKIIDNKTKKVLVNIDSTLQLSSYGGIIKKLNILNQNIALTGLLRLDFIKFLKDKKIDFYIKDLEFIFEPKLPPLKANFLHIRYQQNTIYLNFKNPSCNNISLNNSYAVISNINSKNTILNIKLKTSNLLQSNLLDILEFYKVDLPIYQIKGQNTIDANLSIPFTNNPIKVNLDIISNNTSLKIYDNIFDLKKLNIKLHNNIIKTNLKIKDENKTIIIDNIFDLDKNISKGILQINNFIYKDLITIKDENLSYDINLTKGINIHIKEYDLIYKKTKIKQTVKINKLNKIISFINILKVNTFYPSSLVLQTNNDFNTTYVKINNLYVKLLDNNSSDNNISTKIILPKMYINLLNGNIDFKTYNFPYDKINLKFNNAIVSTKYQYNKSRIYMTTDINKKELLIQSNKLSDKLANKLLKKNIFKNGYLDFYIQGKPNNLNGEIKFYKTTVQNVTILNSLITFINTTPAIINPILALPTLFRMGEKNYNINGYYIQSGQIDFNYNIKNKFINLSNIYTKSKMMDFKAKGNINLTTQKLNINTNVIFMKDHSKFLNHIPIVGYIITGDDGNFMTQVDIYGSFDKPEFETHTVKNASRGAVNMVKRTLGLPFKLIGDIFDQNMTKEEKEIRTKQSQETINNLINN